VTAIGLIGAYGSSNLGDVAIEKALIADLRRRLPTVRIYGISNDPVDTQQCLGIPAFPAMRGALPCPSPSSHTRSRRTRRLVSGLITRLRLLRRELSFLVSSFRVARRLDLLVAAGGGQLDEYWGGAWGYPATLLRWAIMVRLAGGRFAVASVGLCEVESRLGRTFIRSALRLASYRSFRDARTLKELEGWGVGGPNHLVPDMAFAIDLPHAARSDVQRDSEEDERPETIGISPIDSRAWTHPGDPVYSNYRRQVIILARRLIRSGFRVVLFPSQLRMDAPLIPALRDEIQSELGAEARARLFVAEVQSLDSLLEAVSALDLVIASRLHGVLLSHVLSKPVLALSFHHKVDTHMREMDQEVQAVSISELEADDLWEHVMALREDRDGRSRKLTKIVADHRALLEKQTDLLISLATRGASPSD